MTSYSIAIVQEKLKPGFDGKTCSIFIKLDNLTCGSLSCVGLFLSDGHLYTTLALLQGRGAW